MMNKLYYGDNLEVLRKYIKDDRLTTTTDNLHIKLNQNLWGLLLM